MSERVEQILLEDGRHGERHITEEVDCNSGEGVRVVELRTEPDRVLELKKRVKEHIRPCVHKREIETIKDGEVIDRQIESVDHPHQLRMVERQVATDNFSAQSNKDDCCESLKSVVMDLQKAVSGLQDHAIAGGGSGGSVGFAAQSVERPVPVQNEVSKKVEEEEEKGSILDALLAGALVSEIIGIGYVWLFL